MINKDKYIQYIKIYVMIKLFFINAMKENISSCIVMIRVGIYGPGTGGY